MKKLIKVLTKFFIAFYRLIDKCIIIPISRLVFKITSYFKNNSGKLEKIINRPNILIYISLVFAIASFFLVDSKVISLVETEAEIISDQKVTKIFNEEAYVIEGIPDTVDITLIGRKSDLYLAKQLGDHEVVIDLSGYGVGVHEIKLSYKQTIDTLDYKLDPSKVQVVIREKISTLKDITYDLLNQDKLDSKLSVKSIELERSEVIVKGSEETIDKVANVKALIDLNNDDFKDTGSYTLDSVPLVAYDENGEVITNVEVVPGKVSAKVELESFSTEVPIKVLTSGEYTLGYAISSISSSVTKVKVYGDKDVLASITYIPVTIDVTGLKSNKTYNVTIEKPIGVRYISESNTSVDVTIDAETSREISGIKIETQNIGAGLVANAKGGSDPDITVIVKGVASVIDKLTEKDIKAYIDLTGYGTGSHSVPISVTTDDVKVKVVSSIKTLDIIINKK